MKNEIANIILEKYGKKNPPALKPGDTVKVHQKIKEGDKERVQIFEGLVISLKHGKGLDGTFTVRKIAIGGIGVERTYPLHSPNILKVERIKSAPVHRAKLYYMRDRLGKAARFHNETRVAMSWDENGVLIESPAEIEQMVAEESVIETIEEIASPLAEAIEEAEKAEQVAEEAIKEA
jgi:large subunit ribosomal protein L19